MAGRTSSRLGGGLDLLGLGQRRRERPLRAQSGAGFEKAEIEGGASYAAQFAIGETLVKGLEIYRAAETVEETGSPYSASAPGVGRRLHLAYALSEGKCEALEGIVVDGEVLTGDAFVRETDVAAGDGGGATYAATTARGGTLKVTSYLDALDPDAERESGYVARGKTLRDASARMGSEALAWSAEHQGAGISWCHVELEQPVGKDRLVWDGVPELGFLVKGMHLQAPGGDASTLSKPSYTDSAAAVRYWWLRERRSAPADRIDMDTVRDAHVRAGQRIEVRVDETVRYAWLATAAPENGVEVAGTETAPEAPSGNEFLPERPTGLAEDAPWWSKTPAAPTDESPLVWRAESVLDAGDAWSAWDSVVLYQMAGHEPYRDVRPASEAAPVVPAAPTDGSAYVVEFDRYTEGLPAGINPGNREDPVRLALEADATSSRFGVSGVISAADDVNRVEEELDFAWAGSVVEQGGMLCFRPGADGVSAAAIDTSLASQSAVSVEPAPPLEERINAASLSLASSRIHGGGGYSLPAVEDAVSLAADGGSASRDLGEAALLSSPTAARRLLSTALRASQASGIYRYRVDAGDAGAWLSLRPGRQVTVTDAAQGFSDASMLVTGATFMRDTATVELDLVEQSSGTFRDAVALPVRAQRSVSRALARVEEPDLELRELLAPNGDGTFELRLRASWRAHPYESMELQWRRLTPDSRRDWLDAATVLSYGIRVDLAPLRIGERYEVRARHLSRDGVPSRWSYAGSQAVKGDRTAMAAPAGLVGTPMPGGARLEWTHPVEKDYSHTEIHSDIALTAATLVGTVRGTYFEEYFEEYFEPLAEPPVARRYWVRHVDRSGNASAAATATVAPLAVVDRVGVLRDAAYLAQAASGTAPSAPGDIEGNSGWTRKPLAPTQALPVVWQAYREAELDGEPNPTWSEWTAPEQYAVESDSIVPGFTTQVELQFQSLALDGSVVAESATFIEPTYEAPLVEARQRFRASSSAAFPDWNDLVHCWTAVARLTPDGAVYGVKARLDTGFACDPDQERTIYRRSASHLTPANPTGNAAVPPGWYGYERIATSSQPYVYKLTARIADCVWPDWSDAGPPELHDEWTARYFWWITAPEEPVPATPEGFDPFPWMPSRPLLTMPPQCRWVALRAGSPLGGYFWGTPEDDGKRIETSIYMRTASAALPANPSSTLELPPGWSTERLCATATEGFVYCLSVTPTAGGWPWADAEPAVLFDQWTETPWWTLVEGGDQPATPVGDAPAGWSKTRLAFTDAPQCRWKSTREGSDCAGYTWTTPSRDGANEDSRSIYKLSNSRRPQRPGGTAPAVPPGWLREETCSTSTNRYVHCLTVSTVNCVWPDWSRGALVLFDEWTVETYWRLTESPTSPPSPSGDGSPHWVTDEPNPTASLPCLWMSTRSGSPCAGFTWSDPVFVRCRECRTIYKRTNSPTPPPNPHGTAAVPSGWSGTEVCATSTQRCVYCLTVCTTEAGVWPDWSTGTPVLFDKWTETPCWTIVSDGSRPATPVGDAPAGWSKTRLVFTDAPQCRWKSTRKGSDCAGYSWTTPTRDGANEASRTIYVLTNSRTPQKPSGTAPAVPPGWLREETCATSTNRYVHCLTVSTANCAWPRWNEGDLVLSDQWTVTQYWLLTARDVTPQMPTGAVPPPDWVTPKPDFTDEHPCRWTSTQSGSPCADYTWTAPAEDGCKEIPVVPPPRTIYKRTNSPTPPPKPTGTEEVPDGWSAQKGEATDTERYVHSLTVSFENGAWNDWRTGTQDIADKWTETPYWLLTARDVTPATPTGAVPPPDWVMPKPEYTDEDPCRWTSTQSGSPCAGYTWTAPAEDGCKPIDPPRHATFYALTNSSSPPPVEPVPLGPDALIHLPPGHDWSANVECPTSTQRHLWCVTIGGTREDPEAVSGPTLKVSWSDSVWVRLHTSDVHAPPKPSDQDWNVPPPWQQGALPEVSERMRGQWATTRTGHPHFGTDCPLDVSFSNPRLIRRYMYTQYTYQITGSRTTAPGLPPYGPNSGGWNGDPAQVTPTATRPYRWVVGRTRPTGDADVEFEAWGEGAGNAARVDQIFEVPQQFTYRLSSSSTVVPALPPSGPNSGGWNGNPNAVAPNGDQPYRWVVGRSASTSNPASYSAWGEGDGNAPTVDAEWQERSIWIAVAAGTVPAPPTVNYASTPSWTGPGIGSGWYRFNPPFLITQEQDEALDFYSSSQSRVTPGSWSAWGSVSEFHPAVRPIRPPVP